MDRTQRHVFMMCPMNAITVIRIQNMYNPMNAVGAKKQSYITYTTLHFAQSELFGLKIFFSII